MKSTGVPGLEQISPSQFIAPFKLHGLTVFCDFDGPLVDVSERYYYTYQQALHQVQAIYQAQGNSLAVSLLQKSQFWQMKRERTPDIEIAMRSGLQAEQVDVFLAQVHQLVNQPALLHQDRLQPGVEWALSMLHDLGVCLILVTLRCQQQAIEMLDQFGVLHLFSDVHGTRDTEFAYVNPAEQKVQLLKDVISGRPWYGDRPTSAWMIGDTEADILAGQASKIPTVALTCGIRSQGYLERFKPTHICSDLLSASHVLTHRRYAQVVAAQHAF